LETYNSFTNYIQFFTDCIQNLPTLAKLLGVYTSPIPPLAAPLTSIPRDTHQQTRRTPLLLSIDGTDRRTEGRPTVSYYAGSVTKLW